MWTRWGTRLGVLAVCLLPAWGLWRSQGSPMEEGFMLVLPDLVLHGKVPNRDFLYLYGPGSLWFLAAVFAVFGTRLLTERLVGLAQHIGVAFGVFSLMQPWGPWVAMSGGMIAALVVVTPSGLTAMAWIGGIAFGLWSLRAAVEGLDAPPDSKRRRTQLVLAGLLGGAALLYRLDLVLAVGLSLFVVTRGLDRAGRRRLLIALAIGLSPYLIHVATAGPGHAFRGLVTQPVFELRGGRHLPIPPSPDHFDGFLQGAQALNQPHWPLPAPGGPLQLDLWLLLLAGTCAALVAGGVRARRRTGDRRLLAMALFCVGLLPQALQRPDSTHLAWVSCVPLAMLPAAVIELVRGRQRRAGPRQGRRLGAVAVSVPLVLMVVMVPFFTWRTYADDVAKTFGRRRTEQVIRNGDRIFPYNRDDGVAAVNEMLPVVDRLTTPGQRLFVGPGDLRKTPYDEAYLYYLLPRLTPATRFVEMDPGIANAPKSKLTSDLESADVVILSTIFDDWHEPNDSRVFGPDTPNEVLRRDFCLTGKFGRDGLDPDRGLYELYLRCKPRPVD